MSVGAAGAGKRRMPRTVWGCTWNSGGKLAGRALYPTQKTSLEKIKCNPMNEPMADCRYDLIRSGIPTLQSVLPWLRSITRHERFGREARRIPIPFTEEPSDQDQTRLKRKQKYILVGFSGYRGS